MSSAAKLSTKMSEGTVRADWRILQRLWKYLGAQPVRLALSLCLYPLNALCVVLPPYLISRIFDDAIAKHDLKLLWVLGGAYFVSVVCEYLSGFAAEYSMSILGQRAMSTMRADLFAKVQRLPIAYFDTNPIGRILTRLTNDVEALSEVFATGAITMVADLLTLIAVVVMMLRLDARLTLFAFLVAPPMVLIAAVFQRYARHAFRDIRKHIARINTFLAEHISGMSVVQIFRQQLRTQQEFSQLNDDYRHANRQAIFFDASLYAVVEAIGTSATAALIWYGAADLSRGDIQAGVLVAFVQYIRRFFVPLRDLSTKYTVLQSAFAAAERTYALHDEPVFADLEAGIEKTQLSKSIVLKNIWFSYTEPASEASYILRNINLTVNRGEKVALVGATGSGKSTIIKLLNRSYDVQKGAVLLDDVDIRELRLSDVRRLFAVVLQDVHLFSGSLLDNIAFAERVSAEAARRAVSLVGAEDFVARLPNGLDTPVGELGNNFSAGERQLLALARALALNPQILILDEATSNIDSETEARIQIALDVLLKGRTAILVAHRLSTIQKADRIIVLRRGEIIEEGSHQTLLQKQGYYYQLVSSHLAATAQEKQQHPPILR